MSCDERNGWKLYQHPAFGAVFDRLVEDVEAIAKDERTTHPKAKLLKRILEIILDEIPQDPTAKKFRLGNTLGPQHRHWHRAKFLERYRLFFRYHSEQKVIVYGWLNGEKTLRKAGSKSDPYNVFRKRLENGDPPSDWDKLFESSDQRSP